MGRMTSLYDRRDYFVDFEEYEGGKILLGDGRECVCFRIKTKIDIAGQFLNKEGFSGRCSQSIKVIKVSLVGRTLKGRKQLGEFMGGRSRTVWSVQGTGSVQVLQGVEFKVEPREDHTFEVEPHGNVDHVAGSQEVQTQDLIYYHLARDREQHSTHELFSYREDIACDVIPSGRLWMKDVMDARSDVYAEIWATKGLLDKAKGNVLGMEIVRDQSEGSLIKGGCDVKKNGKWSCIYAVGSQEYQMVCTRLDIASADVGMLDSCDCWDYKTNVQVFVDFDYVMGRSINVMLGVDQSQGATVSNEIKFNRKLGMIDDSMYGFMMYLDGPDLYMVMLMMIIKQTHLSETSSSAGVKIHTIPSDKILNRSSERAFVDMSANCYGCVCPVSVVRGCMRLLWLTESRNTTCILFFDIQLTSFSQGTVSLQSAFRDIKGIRHDQLSENAVSSTAIILWITSWSYDLSIELSSEGRLFLDDLDERTLLVSNINLLLQWDIKNASFPSLIDWKRACDAASGQEKSGTASKRAMAKYALEILKKHNTGTICTPFGLCFQLNSISDADHAGCLDTRKSTSGGIQFLEAEYVALSASCAQVMWMRTQLQDYGFNYNKIPLYCDSQSAIAISCNPVQHSRTKHIHTRYHFIKEQVENGIIELYFVRTEYQLADMFTKALPEDRFKYLVRRIGMRCLTPAELEVLTNESA
ncbi:hypothetical protein Tco_0626821 [Tanacetum coccineum]|uniref:Retrovirus-related Pol polyprotein from transposon TNT 1-94 n=1 Tax=Tanacetum coccineum TaxID=301880 RepID=A0ABQ4WKQ8_9ASTR